MKTLSFIVLITLLHLSALATVRTVSNDPTRPAQFTTFAAAQTASIAGDTIYIYGSPFLYPTITVRKRLTIIGAGYGPNNQFGQPTRVQAITLFRDSGSNDASGSVLTGLLVTGSIDLDGTLVSNNITISRNRINSTINLIGASPTGYVNGWTILNNIIDSWMYGGGASRTAPSATNIIIANNIFNQSSYLYGFNSNTVLVDHNLFMGSSAKLNAVFNIIVTNNIFIRTSNNIFTNAVFCTFNNNLSNQSTIGPSSEYSPTNIFEATYTSTGGGSNSGSGNIVGSDPLFVNVTNVDSYNQNFNYRIQASSPGRNGGTDGTDLGIYGGSYPFPSGGDPGSGFDTSPMPPIPQVISVNIQNATIAPNGTLNVKVQGKVNK